ncbi:MAG: hypothetical protein QM809_11565 [Gordonia sp. (in: high G+C Gram-positive bacteria)]|uniref:hypothetical protein n=1 Tax=Gordonia sp. (in: high G+C Gram-positive bacteria) TaxID=84139 RepID=UPI0039E21FAC
MPIHLGADGADRIYPGGAEVDAVYLGDEKVWPAATEWSVVFVGAATTGVFPAHQAGDLLVAVGQLTSGSSTAPTADAGWASEEVSRSSCSLSCRWRTAPGPGTTPPSAHQSWATRRVLLAYRPTRAATLTDAWSTSGFAYWGGNTFSFPAATPPRLYVAASDASSSFAASPATSGMTVRALADRRLLVGDSDTGAAATATAPAAQSWAALALTIAPA